MTTKGESLISKDKQKSFDNPQIDNENRYTNFNLNQSCKCPNLSPFQSNSKSKNDKNISDSTISGDDKFQENLQSWNKSSGFNLNTLNSNNNVDDENAKKNWKKKSPGTNNSTLSLHIFAYENLNETNESFDDGKNNSLIAKPTAADSPFVIQNSFEFPRQQNEKITEPQVSQFRASQRILNPNVGSSSDSSENEFEDAVDTLAPLPSTPSMQQQRPSELCTPIGAGGHTSFMKLDLSAQSSRRNRLATLRNRMQTEFSGAPNMVGSEDDPSQSEKTSLASWGRNFLMERNNDAAVIAVCPADSLSTKATNISFNSNSFFNQPNMSGLGFDTSVSSTTTAKVLNDSIINSTSATLTNNTTIGDKTLIPPTTPQQQQQIPIISATKCYSPSSPPPTVPPPPLPERPIPATATTVSTINNKPPPVLPPPLPPRKTPAKAAKSMTSEQLSPELNNLKQPILSGNNNPLDSSRSSGSTTPSSYGKKRGHVKTNSLDRGLTLAKSIKSGPFPPPSSAVNKSRSLNRGVSPSEMLTAGIICEEEQAAHSVIEQITDSILSACETEDEDDSSDNEENEGENQKENTVAPLPPPSRPPFPSKTIESNLMAVGEESCSATSTPTKASDPPQLPPSSQYANLLLEEPIENKIISVPLNSTQDSSMHNTQTVSENSMSLTTTTNNSLQSHSESFDPISQDIQRRMSMKNHTPSDIHNNENEDDQQNEVQTGLEHAKNIVKSYGSIATGFFRGAISKARKSIAPHSNPPKALSAAKEDDEEAGASDSDEGTPSISENIPPSLNPQSKKSAEPEIICRPKNHKKGPYDFDQLRVIQEINTEHTGAIWCVKFSVCGRLIATAGQDNIVRIWVLKSYLNHFTKVREKLNSQTSRATSNSANPELSFAMQDLEIAIRNAEDKVSNLKKFF
uniref:WD repeat-containing protein 44 n=1 Tax=Panagrolaimus sp. PS1159 TaxID=55785 RepID=A0AC35G9S6_9BILA